MYMISSSCCGDGDAAASVFEVNLSVERNVPSTDLSRLACQMGHSRTEFPFILERGPTAAVSFNATTCTDFECDVSRTLGGLQKGLSRRQHWRNHKGSTTTPRYCRMWVKHDLSHLHTRFHLPNEIYSNDKILNYFHLKVDITINNKLPNVIKRLIDIKCAMEVGFCEEITTIHRRRSYILGIKYKESI
ncbi:hypothetical protein CBL_04049 [Carabus blaptoides fortunei]